MEEQRNEVEKRVEKAVEKGVTNVVTTIITAAVTFALSVVVLKFVWAWVASDLFPGAVVQGLINAELTWLAAVKFAVLAAVVVGINTSLMDAFKRK